MLRAYRSVKVKVSQGFLCLFFLSSCCSCWFFVVDADGGGSGVFYLCSFALGLFFFKEKQSC